MIPTLDFNFITMLKNIQVKEPGLFNNNFDEIVHQLEFLFVILKKYKGVAKNILEIGTNKGFFDYFANVCIPKVHIDTVDIDFESKHAIDLINSVKNGYVHFHNCNSEDFFKKFKPDYKIDFAWVDGGHDCNTCFCDLVGCANLDIPLICLDDYRSNMGVIEGLCKFMKVSDYMPTGMSSFIDTRGILCLEKIDGIIT